MKQIITAGLALWLSGCTAFMAGYRTSAVRAVEIGEPSSLVVAAAGRPQGHEAVATAAGNVEIWHYTIHNPGKGLEDYPIAFLDGRVAAVGTDGASVLVADEFYEAYPKLRGKERCVARTLAGTGVKTWGALAAESFVRCTLNENWVPVATGSDGGAVYVDTDRIEIREQNQISFWQAHEAFDEGIDFLVVRNVVDCDKSMVFMMHSVALVAGQYKMAEDHPVHWASVLPGSTGEAIVRRVCQHRAAEVSSRGRRSAPKSPPPRPATKESAPTGNELHLRGI